MFCFRMWWYARKVKYEAQGKWKVIFYFFLLLRDGVDGVGGGDSGSIE